MPVLSTNHGLTVLTRADADAPATNGRLQRPVATDYILTTTFNDATSGDDYDHSSGHEGIDFNCPPETDVVAMYGGTITVGTSDPFYGTFVRILSYTNQAETVGFEHTYAHLNSVADENEVVLETGDTVVKGDQIGTSGNTGGVGPHLHVHVKPFAQGGTSVTRDDNPQGCHIAGGPDHTPETLVADRISGCMNFACFLPADHGGPAITADGLLLSARDANAGIPVYREFSSNNTLLPDDALHAVSNRLGTIDGSRIGCYAVKATAKVGTATWYQIQFAGGGGWVSRLGDVVTDGVTYEDVQWVQVEDSLLRELPGRLAPVAVITSGEPYVRTEASTANDDSRRGTLKANIRYPIVGTNLSAPLAAGQIQDEARWWQIDLGPGIARIAAWTGSIPDSGWVRSDVVRECGDLSGVPVIGAPAPVVIGRPQDLNVAESSAVVTLTWRAPEGSVGVTGYRIWRFRGTEAVIFNSTGPDTRWVDTTNALAGTVLHYGVAARVGSRVGLPTSFWRVVIGGQTSAQIGVPIGGERVSFRPRPDLSLAGSGFMDMTRLYDVREVLEDPNRSINGLKVPLWFKTPTASSALAQGRARSAARSSQTEGWVQANQVQLTGSLAGLPRPPFARVTAPGVVPVRPGPDLGYTEYVAQIERSGGWYALLGKNGRWWQVRVAAATVGWLRAQDVETTGAVSDVSFVDESPAPEPAGPGGTRPGGHAVTRDSGHYLNLANSWGGAWAVSKAGREVTAAFQSTRSPVQWYARQNPRDLAVLPAAFRPTVTQNIRGAGVHVTEAGVPYPQSAPAPFTLRVSTTGQVRYVDGAELDHVGFLRYEIGTADSGVSVTWRTATAVEEPVDPTPPGDLSASGTYHNQQDNWGSRWALAREGNAVSGTFTTTRSAAEYYANDENPEALLWLPGEYWPDQDVRFRVTGAVRVNKDGTDSPDTRLVNFWITVQRSDGRMYYDPDTALEAAGVGYVRYTVDVDWTAVARLTVPSAPQELETDDVAAEEVELDWDRPADDGGDRVDEYRVEIYRGGRWRTEEDDISRTRYTVENLNPYTRYTFRVAAHNAAGWGPASAEVAVTTRRAEPGQPHSLAAAATHDRVTLTWQAPTAGGRVTGYRVQRRVGSGRYQVVADTGTVTYFVDRDVIPATTYSYQVRALHYGEEGNPSGRETVSTRAAPTIPGRPTALGVAPSAESQLQLTWTAPSDPGGGVTGYRIEQSPDVNPRTWTEVVADTRRTARVWDAPELAADTIYHYQVSARNSAGVSMPSTAAQGQTRPQLRLDLPVMYPLTAHAEPRGDAAVTATFGFFLPERTYDLVGQVPGAAGWWQVLLFGQTAQGPFWLPARAGTALGATAALPQLPAAPASFTATLARGAVALSWTAPLTGGPVRGYRLWRQQDDAAFAPLGADLAAAATTYTDSTVQHDHVYRYWLQGLSEAGPGLPSATVALAVMATPAAPDAVPTVNVAATPSTLLLSWGPAPSGGLPSGYRVQWRRGGTTDAYQQVEVTGTTHQLTDLIPGTAYAFQVTAFNQEGDAPATAQTGTTVQVAPGVPETLEVVVAGQAATVTWQVPATGGRPDAYHLQSKTQATAAWPVTYTTVTGLSHTLSGLGYEVAQDLRVRAHNTAGESAWVTEIFTTAARPRVPGIPTGVTALPGVDSQMELRWVAAADGSAATGYRIERSADVDPRVWTEVLADSGTPDTTWADSGLAAATVYHYQVTGRNAAGLGTPAAAAPGTTRPQLTLQASVPYPLRAHAWPLATAPVTHTWNVHDAALTLDVMAQGAGGGGWYRVLRFGEGAGGPYWLPASAVTVSGAPTALPQAPGVPGELAPPLATHDTVTLSWSAPSTGGTVTGYRLWRQTGEADFRVLGSDLAADVLTHTDTTVAASTAYQYRLQALATAGAGVRTPAVSITTAATPRAPGRPPALTAQPTADSQMQLTWSAPLDAGTQPITGYRIERAVAADPLVWADAVADTGTLDLTWADTGLAADTTYHYQVSARNAVGLSDPAAAQGTTRPQLTLLAAATYPLSAHQWPAATAPVTHTWSAHDAAVQLDLVAQGAGGGGWYRALRFGASAGGPYWLPANAVIVSGATTALPQTPGAPGDLQTSNLQGQVTLTWMAPPTGGTVTGYRLWRQTGEAAWTVLGSELSAATLTYTDSTVMAGTTYQYRLQARAEAGYGVRTAAVTAAVTAPPVAPAPPAYFGVAQIAATTAQLFWDPVAGATGYDVELRQAWYAADHAAARVRLPRVGTVTLRTGADRTVELTVLRTGTLVELRGLPASYSYWDLYVRATNAGGASGWAETYVSNDAAALAPRQPTGLRGLRRAAGTADLHWDAVAGATAYRVYFDFPDDDRGAAGWDWLPYRDVAVTVTAATATVSGLPPTPGPWSLRVSALSGGRESVRAAALAVSTAAAARVPGVPPALTAAPGADSQMQLSWTEPVDAGTQPLTGYRIERSADVNPRVWTEVLADSGLTATTWADSGLAAATPYHYQVSARNAVGTGQPSAEAPGTTRPQAALRVTAAYPLTAHQGPAATAPVTHTWTAHDGGVPLDVVAQAAGGSWYRVLRFGHAPGGPYWLPAAAVTVTGATTDLPQVPAAPTGLTAAPSDESQMQLSWQAAPTGSAATGYRIERSADVDPRVWREVVADSGTPATTWADSGLAAATVYHYRVTGRNAAGLGTPAEAAPGTTRPQLTLLASAPYPLLAQAWPLATAPVTHTWSAHDAAITLDVMAQGAGGGGWYRVLRFGASANGPYWLPASAVSVTGATMALPQAPGGPGDLMPPTATHNSVTLTWTAPTTGGTVTGYRLWRQTGEADFRALGADLAAATLTFTDTPVLASTLYQYRVQARAAAGYGPRTPAVSVTTAAPPRTPGRPTELRAAPGADSQMQLTWAAPVDPGTPPLTGYRMERSADVLPRVWTEVLADTGTPDRTWTDSGLAAATTYHYQVSGRNAVGVGQPSGATSGQSRPQLALRVTATYPLTAHAWPAATAPVTQTWSAHDAQVVLDLTAQGAGGDGWYRALRFGQAARGPYWLPARAVTVTGATSDLPQAPGAPADLQTTETQGQVVLIWNAPATGGTVTGYRLWRQRGEAAWAALDGALAAHTYTYTDTAVTTDTPYQYRLQAQSAAGYGVRTAALSAAVTPPPPGDLTYFGAAQTAATTVELAWDAVPGATGYEVEIQQSHGDAYVLLPAAGTFALRTGPATTDSVTVTVTRTGPTLQLTGLPASYSSWHLYLRATNAGGSSGWRGATVSNNPQQWAPSAPTGLTGRRSAAGTVALSWNVVTGATAYRLYFRFPADTEGPAGWDWLPYRGVTGTGTGATATVSGLPPAAATWELRVSALNGFAESLASPAFPVANPSA